MPVQSGRVMAFSAMSASSETVIRQVTQGIWTFSKPYTALLGLLPVGGRSTAIKLASGDVWVLASTPLTSETKETLDSIGPVKYIVASNDAHHLYTDEFHAAYPAAKMIGTPGLVAKKAGKFTWDGVYGKDPAGTKYGYESEIEVCHFSGHKNNELAILHQPSKTLIQADLMMNLPATEQYSKSTARSTLPFLGSRVNPWATMHKRMVWGFGVDRAAMKRDAQTVAGWDFTRIIPCHGDVIEERAKDAWKELYKWYLEYEGK